MKLKVPECGDDDDEEEEEEEKTSPPAAADKGHGEVREMTAPIPVAKGDKKKYEGDIDDDGVGGNLPAASRPYEDDGRTPKYDDDDNDIGEGGSGMEMTENLLFKGGQGGVGGQG